MELDAALIGRASYGATAPYLCIRAGCSRGVDFIALKLRAHRSAAHFGQCTSTTPTGRCTTLGPDLRPGFQAVYWDRALRPTV